MAGAPVHRLPCLHHGSSPHEWGTLASTINEQVEIRFIPACAGNASRALTRRGPTSVHPRMRGERSSARIHNARLSGSSPHTRGTPAADDPMTALVRFIPAYAGNALALHAGTSSPAVHPRIRGERDSWKNAAVSTSGSSPHTRGTHVAALGHRRRSRFIPAYAGNAHPRWKFGLATAVHPRIRGERMGGHPPGNRDGGSSPHTRGTLCILS